MNPFKNNKTTKFEILLSDYFAFRKKDILSIDKDNNKIEVISPPTLHYKKWYWKTLNFMTFKLFFNVRYTYLCRIKE